VAGAAWVSRRVIDGERPGYVERTTDRINEFDSGWRFYAGDESEAYLDEVANCVMEHLAHAVERWSEVADLVANGPSAGHWLWDAQQRRYREI
jgi:hypothetical protein